MSTPFRPHAGMTATVTRTPSHRAFCAAALLPLALGLSLVSGCGGHAAAPSAITLTGPASDAVEPGGSASFTSAVTGGPSDAGVTWALTGCPASSCGTLSNVTLFAVTYTAPATVATAFTVTLTATSTAKSSVTQTVTLSVPASLAFTTAPGALPAAAFGVAYATTLAATGGIPPYTWTIAQGALPAGLALSSAGVLSGTPSSVGTASFTVKLTDAGSPPSPPRPPTPLTTGYPPLASPRQPCRMASTARPTPHRSRPRAAAARAIPGASRPAPRLSAVGLSLSPRRSDQRHPRQRRELRAARRAGRGLGGQQGHRYALARPSRRSRTRGRCSAGRLRSAEPASSSTLQAAAATALPRRRCSPRRSSATAWGDSRLPACTPAGRAAPAPRSPAATRCTWSRAEARPPRPRPAATRR